MLGGNVILAQWGEVRVDRGGGAGVCYCYTVEAMGNLGQYGCSIGWSKVDFGGRGMTCDRRIR